MTYELILTSVAQGLDPKERGFCPVAADAAISPRIVQHLSALSHYRHLDAEPEKSPAAYSHFILPGGIEHVLSRVADFGLDYKQKPNVLAHHVVLEGLEVVAETPAWLLALPGFHFSEWNEPPLRFAHGRPIPTLTNPQSLTRRQQIARQHRWLDPQKTALTGAVDTQSETYLAAVQNNDDQAVLAAAPTTPCPAWQELTGDAGWGGVLAETVFTKQPVVLIYNPGQNILPLFVEALALLPSYVAWQTTFSTYFTGLPETISCQWKGVLAGSDEVKTLIRDVNHLVFDFTVPMGAAPPGQYVDYARHGHEHLLPFDNEQETVALAEADTKSHDPEDTQKTKIDVSPNKMSESALPAIQLPKKQAGLFESFLRRSSRFQFYLLYSIMFVLLLFLIVLAIDQVAGWGIVQKLRTGSSSTNIVLPDDPEPEQEIDSELDEKADPEEIEQPILTEAERILKTFETERENQREPLFQFLESFTVPEFLAAKFPDVWENVESPPETAMFDELAPLLPFAAALELRFVPLLELPGMEIETEFDFDALPDLVWEVKAIDPDTGFDTPMFRFQWTDAGLEMDWQPDGMSGSYLYDTVLSSLGFLELSVAGEPESAMEIPLFASGRVEPVRVADLVPEIGTDAPEYVVDLPFASELWQSAFAYMEGKELPIKVLLVSTHLAGTPAPLELPAENNQVKFEIRTSQQANVPVEDGKIEHETVTITFTATASLASIVWKEDGYAERLSEEQELVQSRKVALDDMIEQLRVPAFDGDIDARAERSRLNAEFQELKLDGERIENILGKLPAAYAEIGENETLRVRYSVFLESFDGEQKLLILTTD